MQSRGHPGRGRSDNTEGVLLAQMSQLSDQLAGQPSAADWRRLAEVTLTTVIVLNGRRGSEAAQLLVSEYELRTNNVQCSLMCSTV